MNQRQEPVPRPRSLSMAHLLLALVARAAELAAATLQTQALLPGPAAQLQLA